MYRLRRFRSLGKWGAQNGVFLETAAAPSTSSFVFLFFPYNHDSKYNILLLLLYILAMLAFLSPSKLKAWGDTLLHHC